MDIPSPINLAPSYAKDIAPDKVPVVSMSAIKPHLKIVLEIVNALNLKRPANVEGGSEVFFCCLICAPTARMLIDLCQTTKAAALKTAVTQSPARGRAATRVVAKVRIKTLLLQKAFRLKMK